MKQIPYLIDTTLRDGEQAPGVVFSLDDKINISKMLDKAGIPEIEIGTPAMGDKEISDIQAIINCNLRFKTLSWCRALKTDINKARKAGTNGVHISFPLSDIHLYAMGKTQEWIFRTMNELIPYAIDHFEYVTLGAQDASRADLHLLMQFIEKAQELGSSRIRIADTVGILNPFSTFSLLESIIQRFHDMPFEFHGHNDLNMATANTLAAFKAGASCASVTVNGVGERAGNAALEEVVIGWELSFNEKLNFNTTILGALSDMVSKASGIAIPENKPIVGKKVLTHETGIHTNLLLKDRKTYQIIEANSIGKNENEFVFGKHSGIHAIKTFYKKYKMVIEEHKFESIAQKIKSLSSVYKRNLSELELLELIEKV
jgi:homocitrate synthase NifV